MSPHLSVRVFHFSSFKFCVQFCIVITELINIKFTLTAVNTNSVMINVFIENHSMFRPYSYNQVVHYLET
jgi:hypothetical protein